MQKLPALLALTLVLAACGTSQTTTPAVTPAAQVISGTITALSADHRTLTVAGQTLTLSLGTQSLSLQGLQAQAGKARVKVNGDDANELALSVGQHVTVHVSGDSAAEIDIEKELRGVVASVDVTGGTLVIAGQTVKVDAATRIELSRQESSTPSTLHTLADVKVGAFAEISGTRDPAGVLLATSIEVRSGAERHEQGEDDQSEVHGTVSDLNADAKTFTAHGTKVDYNTATVTGTPANGGRIEAKGSYDAATKVFTATRVEAGSEGEHHGDQPVAGDHVRLEEKVTSLDEAGKRLVAGGYTVDYSAAIVTGTPAVRAEVRVVGLLDATDANLVHATEVRFERAEKEAGTP